MMLIFLLASISTAYSFAINNLTDTKELELALSRLMKPGESLRGRSIEDILPNSYRVAASGAVENYTKWPLHLTSSEVASGTVTMPLSNVLPGMMEAFAARKTKVTATGIWVRYSLVLDDDMIVHFMFSAPFDFTYYPNRLALALCMTKNDLCQSMTANNMYYNDYPFMEKGDFYKAMIPVRKCFDDVCMIGSMLTSHQTIIRIKIYPKSFYDLSYSMKKEKAITPDEYGALMRQIFNL